jgi:serine/threonine-protein kinase
MMPRLVGAPDATIATQVLPTQLGRYRLCFRIASGGMATVYLARADGGAGLQLLVALKRIHPHLAVAPGFIDMFLDEARIASRIRHTNVCAVLDFEAKGALSYLVMEYLSGESLMQVLRALARADGMGVRAAVRIARAVADACEGLHAAHELASPTGEPLQIVHRDVSPQNLFLTYEGVVKVVDFGVASAAHRTHETKTGMLKGKLAYLPPEALSGRPIDRRGDVWGLGVVLWELLTGRRLFARPTDAETVRALAEPIVPPSQVSRGVPPVLDAIVLRALHRNIEERYATARDLGRDLLKLIHEVGMPIGPAELSDWMDELFPSGRACSRQILDLAAQMDPIEITPDPEPSPAHPSQTPARRTPVPKRSLARLRRSMTLAATTFAIVLAATAAAIALARGQSTVEASPPPRPPPANATPATPIPGPACEESAAPQLSLGSTIDPLLFEVWPELGDDGRVVLRLRPRFVDGAVVPQPSTDETTPLHRRRAMSVSDDRWRRRGERDTSAPAPVLDER